MGGSERGTSGEQMRNRSDLPETSTGMWTGAPPEPVTHQPGQQRSEEAGMQQVSMAIRESWEEGDPELQHREEELHARQQNLGERERSLRERDEQLRMREQGLRERQSRVMGKGMGATDYTDDLHIQNRR
jgi:hypothetical protein